MGTLTVNTGTKDGNDFDDIRSKGIFAIFRFFIMENSNGNAKELADYKDYFATKA